MCFGYGKVELLTLTAVFISSTLVFAAKYEYDELGRLTKVEYDSKQITKSVSYSYDVGGNIKAVSGFMSESVIEVSTESTSEPVSEATTEDITENSTVEAVWNYSTGENTDGFFNVNANNWSNAVPFSYGDDTLTKAIKMESSSSIGFTVPQSGTLTLVTYSTQAEPTVIINGTAYPVNRQGATVIEIPASGAYTITKGTTNTYIYYMSFAYEVAAPTPYIWNFTDGTNTDDFYTVSANSWSNPVAISYEDQTLNKAIKMETNSSVSFTAEKAGKLTVVTYSTQTAPTITVNGQVYPVSPNGATEILIPEGSCTITKGTTNTYLYYLSLLEQ